MSFGLRFGEDLGPETADFTSTMDVVMTPEERAEMEAAEKEAEAESKGEPTAASVKHATTSVPSQNPAAAEEADPAVPVTATGTTSATDSHGAPAAEDSLRSLSLHTGERPAAQSASSSSDQLSKQKEKGKGKSKLTPEQKAKLDELEKKQDEEKEKRWAS